MRATFKDPELQRRFEQDGYVVVPFLTPEEAAELDAAYDDLGPAPGDPQRACIATFFTWDTEYKLAADRLIATALGPRIDELFDDHQVMPGNFVVKWPGDQSGFGLHQDLSILDETQFRSCEVWCALTDTDAANGQLWLTPGSHRWRHHIRGIHAFPSLVQGQEDRVINRHSVAEPLKAGEAIIFDHATYHFSLPNRTDRRRVAATIDLIPREAQHLHYFGDGQGRVDTYEIDASFWVEQNPFVLVQAPPSATPVASTTEEFVPLSSDDLDRLVAEGRAIEHEDAHLGSINAAEPWCHRCGTTDGTEGYVDRLSGNITLLCPSCAAVEMSRIAHTASA